MTALSLAVIAIAVPNRKELAPKVNTILTKYGDYIIGRMGLRDVSDHWSLISLIVKARADEIKEFVEELRREVPDAKVTYTRVGA